jgi:hypothetical protein
VGCALRPTAPAAIASATITVSRMWVSSPL